jgi:hypothetical protein
MKIFGIYLASAGVFLGALSAHAGTEMAPADSSITPPQMGGYWESKNQFYAEVDGGAVFLNTPKKDNSNFFNDPVELSRNGQSNALGSFHTDSTAASVGGKFGYILSATPRDSWMGHNLRVEASGSYFQTDTSDSGRPKTADPADTAFWIEPLNGQINSSNYFGVAATPHVTETNNDYFYEGGAALKSDYYLGHNNEFTITPSIGFDYAQLGQHFDTSGKGTIDHQFTGFNQDEKIDTDYYGLKLGFELRANVSKQFVMFLDGDLSPVLAYSDYHGQQGINGGNGITTSQANDNANEFTFHGSLDGGIAYDFGPVIIKFSGGFQYWDYAATVKEAELPQGAQIPGFGPVTHAPVQSSHLVSTSMLNPEVTGSVIVPF